MASYPYYAEKKPEIMVLPHEDHLHAVVRQVWFKTHDALDEWMKVGDREQVYRRACPPKPLEL